MVGRNVIYIYYDLKVKAVGLFQFSELQLMYLWLSKKKKNRQQSLA